MNTILVRIVPLLQTESKVDVYDEIDTFSLDFQAVNLSTTKLGSGQFGEVWKGHLKKNNRSLAVAVKIVKGKRNVILGVCVAASTGICRL